MRIRFLLLFFTVHHAICLFAQPASSIRTQKIPTYIVSNQQTKTQIVTMPFAKAAFIDTTGMYSLANKDIISVHYVYTDYPAQQSLITLRQNRISLLVNTFKFLQQPTIEWKVFRQTNGYSKATAENMLHGFVITYREKQTNIVVRKQEIELIKSFTPTPPATSTIVNDGKRRWNKLIVKGIYPNPKEFIHQLNYGDSVVRIATSDLKNKQLLTPKEIQYFGKKDSLWAVLLVPKPPITKRVFTIEPADSSVTNYFLQHTPNKPFAIVADVTGSMSAYNWQLLQYLNSVVSSKSVVGICFFNDGDKQLTHQKKIGSTGGIYITKSSSIIEIQKLLLEAMQNGDGGDLPENNCEATIKAIDAFPAAESIVLIADNIAPVRDISLLPLITKPVHIIISGKDLGIQPQLLNMAYKTNGSIFFDNQLVQVKSLFAGKQPILLRGMYYTIMNEEIIPFF